MRLRAYAMPPPKLHLPTSRKKTVFVASAANYLPITPIFYYFLGYFFHTI